MGPSSKPRSKLIREKWSSVCVLQSCFINFFLRTHRFGAISADRLDQILISEKIDIFDENCENGRFCCTHNSMKTTPTEKTEYTTTKPTENARKLSSQIFDFWILSQRFFDLKLAIFRFFKISQKHKFWRFWPPNCRRFLNT